jgi:cyclopropane fatty-acyl-phospholipid synthase-like methyltransferase
MDYDVLLRRGAQVTDRQFTATDDEEAETMAQAMFIDVQGFDEVLSLTPQGDPLDLGCGCGG